MCSQEQHEYFQPFCRFCRGVFELDCRNCNRPMWTNSNWVTHCFYCFPARYEQCPRCRRLTCEGDMQNCSFCLYMSDDEVQFELEIDRTSRGSPCTRCGNCFGLHYQNCWICRDEEDEEINIRLISNDCRYDRRDDQQVDWPMYEYQPDYIEIHREFQPEYYESWTPMTTPPNEYDQDYVYQD